MPNDDLISRKALIEEIEEDAKHMMFTSYHARMLHDDMVEFAINAIECAPAVEVEPVRHGKWIRQDGTFTRYMCSECERRNYQGFENYCPNCGAKMHLEEDTKCTQ